jgi:hypothetical protein
MAGPWGKYAPAQPAQAGPWDKYAPAQTPEAEQPHSYYTPQPPKPPVPLVQRAFEGAKDLGKGVLESVGGAADTIGAPAGWLAHGLGFAQETPEQRKEQEQLFKPVNATQAVGAGAGDALQAMIPVEKALPIAGKALGRMVEALPIPTRAKAGKLFEQVMAKAGDQPVQLSNSMGELTRAQELTRAGGGNPTPVNALVRRLDDFQQGPLTYREARDYAPNLSRTSVSDSMAMSPTMQRQVGKLSHAFNEDVGAAAERGGMGAEHAKAMRDYARAARLSELASSVGSKARKALPYVAYPAGGYLGYKVVNELLPK